MAHTYILDPTQAHEKFFEDICQVPHGSYNEKPLSDWLVNFARERGLKYKQYDNSNVIIYVDASEGYEDHEPVMLQGHMDMVCEKKEWSSHNFETDPLELKIEDGWIKANGTTLGADDGLAIAYCLAIADDKSLPHPPLELVMTVQEEIGCLGAEQLVAEDIRSRRMIGLDDIGGDSSTIAAAGSFRGVLEKSFSKTEKKSCAVLKLDGFVGGHSGALIHEERANAAHLAARILLELSSEDPIWIASVKMDGKVNVIPQAAEVVFASDLPTEALNEKVQHITAGILEEYKYSDPHIAAHIFEADVQPVFNAHDSNEILEFLFMIPDGMFHMCKKFDCLTSSSSNIGCIETEDEAITIYLMARGMIDSFLADTQMRLNILAKQYGWKLTCDNRAAGWDYKEDSHMREVLVQAYREVIGEPLKLIPEHGGIEAGFISRIFPDMDIVMMGARVVDYHTPEERMDRESFANTYEIIRKMLAAL